MKAIFAFIVVLAVVAAVASSPLLGKDGNLLDVDVGKLVDIDLGIPKLGKDHNPPATNPKEDDCEVGSQDVGGGGVIPEVTTKKKLIDVGVGDIIDVGVDLPILGGIVGR